MQKEEGFWNFASVGIIITKKIIYDEFVGIICTKH